MAIGVSEYETSVQYFSDQRHANLLIDMVTNDVLARSGYEGVDAVPASERSTIKEKVEKDIATILDPEKYVAKERTGKLPLGNTAIDILMAKCEEALVAETAQTMGVVPTPIALAQAASVVGEPNAEISGSRRASNNSNNSRGFQRVAATALLTTSLLAPGQAAAQSVAEQVDPEHTTTVSTTRNQGHETVNSLNDCIQFAKKAENAELKRAGIEFGVKAGLGRVFGGKQGGRDAARFQQFQQRVSAIRQAGLEAQGACRAAWERREANIESIEQGDREEAQVRRQQERYDTFDNLNKKAQVEFAYDPVSKELIAYDMKEERYLEIDRVMVQGNTPVAAIKGVGFVEIPEDIFERYEKRASAPSPRQGETPAVEARAAEPKTPKYVHQQLQKNPQVAAKPAATNNIVAPRPEASEQGGWRKALERSDVAGATQTISEAVKEAKGTPVEMCEVKRELRKNSKVTVTERVPCKRDGGGQGR